MNQFAIVYTAHSHHAPVVGLALTSDFQSFDRVGPILPPENKDAALFPRRFGQHWAMIHRPVPWHPGFKANMWISFSPDLVHWGQHQVLLECRPTTGWDSYRIGLSTPPLETPYGWLISYHGQEHVAERVVYRVGLALLDLEQPTHVLARSVNWCFAPETDYELRGAVPGVVFPTGITLEPGSGLLRMYYGSADSHVGLASSHIDDVLTWLMRDTTTPQS